MSTLVQSRLSAVIRVDLQPVGLAFRSISCVNLFVGANSVPNPEHLEILKFGFSVWNRWRDENPTVGPDLGGADLKAADLRRFNFFDAGLAAADLSGAMLAGANLVDACLDEAKLQRANLTRANLLHARMNGANLSGATLLQTNVVQAWLRKANLTGAKLLGTNLTGSHVEEADFTGAVLDGAVFAAMDLSQVKGLESVEHQGHSTIGIDTIYLSQGRISEIFLRGAGVPDELIMYIRSLRRWK